MCITTTPTFSSFIYNRAVRNSQVPAIARHVGMTLATYARKAGDAYRGQDTLTRVAGWARRAVNDVLKTLR